MGLYVFSGWVGGRVKSWVRGRSLWSSLVWCDLVSVYLSLSAIASAGAMAQADNTASL